MHTPSPLVSPEMAFASFDLVSFGQVDVPVHPLRFGFQVAIIPALSPPQVLFGLVTRGRDADSRAKTHGFAVRLDLTTGEVWDVLNDSGLMGWLDEPEKFHVRFTDEEPMLLSWQVEHLGTALIPRLHIGGDEWLYPALPYAENMVMDTIAGGAGDKGSTLTAFLHPALWRESL